MISPHSLLPSAALYSGDVFAYSLPGGFVKAVPRAVGPADERSRSFAAALPEGQSAMLVTDAACDLPAEWLSEHQVVVLPIKLRFDSRSRHDSGDTQASLDFVARDLENIGSDVQALPMSASDTAEFILETLGPATDFVLGIPHSSHRGSGYMNALTAAQNLMLQHGRARRQDGVVRPFKVWVIDSTTVCNGQGVLVDESVRALAVGMTMSRLVQHLDLLRKHVQTLIVPRDVAFFRRHSHMHFEPAIHWLSFGVGRVLSRTPVIHAHAGTMDIAAQARDHSAAITHALEATAQQVREGLVVPCVCVSYAGDVSAVRLWPAFVALQENCRSLGVTLHLATMCMTNSVQLGAQALSISFAS